MKNKKLKLFILECMQNINEGKMGGKRKADVPVYDIDRKTILAYVDRRASSIGASKAAGKKAAMMAIINGKHVWVIKELNDREKMALPPEEEDFDPNENLADEVSEERDYRKEYDNYHKKPEQRRNNDKRKQARRNMTYAGKVHKGDGKDVDHKIHLSDGGSNEDSNLRVRSVKANRADNGQGK